MSILVRFAPDSVSTEQYDEAVSKLQQDGGEWPADGLDISVCFKANGGIHVSEIWDSQEKFDAFGERLTPVLSDLGIDPGEPTLIEIHNIIRR